MRNLGIRRFTPWLGATLLALAPTAVDAGPKPRGAAPPSGARPIETVYPGVEPGGAIDLSDLEFADRLARLPTVRWIARSMTARSSSRCS